MGTYRPIKLSVLRDIGWEKWDPIGLLASGQKWDHEPFADEYDGYLLKAAGDLRRKVPLEEVVGYLLRIEREGMGLGVRSGQTERAEATARSIQSYILELDQ
jgi:hypothetical protein